jgi:hypothetical protein
MVLGPNRTTVIGRGRRGGGQPRVVEAAYAARAPDDRGPAPEQPGGDGDRVVAEPRRPGIALPQQLGRAVGSMRPAVPRRSPVHAGVHRARTIRAPDGSETGITPLLACHRVRWPGAADGGVGWHSRTRLSRSRTAVVFRPLALDQRWTTSS